MIELSAEATSVLTGSYQPYLAVESWLDGELLAADIPVDSASEESDQSLTVPERVTLALPRTDRGANWSPIGDDHPLAANGQRLYVKCGIGLDYGRVEWFQRGEFLIEDSSVDGDTVNVAAVGLLALINEARLVSPFQPSGTIVSALRALVEPALTVYVDPALTDRNVPAAINYDEDRLAAMGELLDAWPAHGYIDPQGFLRTVPAALGTTPVLTLTDGAGGTVIRASGGSTRDGAYNVVVARGTASDGAQVQGVAYATSGPKRYGGPFNPLPVPFYFSSPLLATVAECNAAARTVLERKQREAGREYTVELVPHPGVQLRDVVALTSAELGLAGTLCSVEKLGLPYLSGGGTAMTLTVRTLP